MAITTNSLKAADVNFDTFGATKGIPWTPHDDNYIEDPDNAGVQVASKGISFGTAGALVLTNLEGNQFTIPNGALVAGVIHPIRHIVKIDATGTGATDIVVWV